MIHKEIMEKINYYDIEKFFLDFFEIKELNAKEGIIITDEMKNEAKEKVIKYYENLLENIKNEKNIEREIKLINEKINNMKDPSVEKKYFIKFYAKKHREKNGCKETTQKEKTLKKEEEKIKEDDSVYLFLKKCVNDFEEEYNNKNKYNKSYNLNNNYSRCNNYNDYEDNNYDNDDYNFYDDSPYYEYDEDGNERETYYDEDGNKCTKWD